MRIQIRNSGKSKENLTFLLNKSRQFFLFLKMTVTILALFGAKSKPDPSQKRPVLQMFFSLAYDDDGGVQVHG